MFKSGINVKLGPSCKSICISSIIVIRQNEFYPPTINLNTIHKLVILAIQNQKRYLYKMFYTLPLVTGLLGNKALRNTVVPVCVPMQFIGIFTGCSGVLIRHSNSLVSGDIISLNGVLPKNKEEYQSF